MHKIIQIYPCLLKLSGKQESVTDRQTATITTGISPHRFMVFNTTFNNISVILWQSVFLMEETAGVPGLKKTTDLPQVTEFHINITLY
jgi:hypothetical protein